MTTKTPDQINAERIAEQRADLAAGRLVEVRDTKGRVIAVQATATYFDTPERQARLEAGRKAKANHDATYPYARNYR